MTPAELKAEIESRPELAALWADVFEPHETKREQLAFREGHLKPDAAFEIAERLRAAGVPVGHYEEVAAAKRA